MDSVALGRPDGASANPLAQLAQREGDVCVMAHATRQAVEAKGSAERDEPPAPQLSQEGINESPEFESLMGIHQPADALVAVCPASCGADAPNPERMVSLEHMLLSMDSWRSDPDLCRLFRQPDSAMNSGGKLDRQAHMQGLSPAPGDIHELMAWPISCWERLRKAVGGALDHDAMRRAVSWLTCGVVMSTAYSGVGAAEISSHLGVLGGRASGYLAEAAPGFIYSSACDVKTAAQRILRDHTAARSAHIFTDINMKLTPKVVRLLDGLTAKPESTLDEKRQAFQEMRSLLEELEPQLFRVGRKRRCELHDDMCSIFGNHPRGSGDALGQSLSNWGFDDVFIDTRDRPRLRLHIAGLTCKDYSKRNRKAVGMYGPSGRPLLIWAYERRFEKEDLIITENTRAFPEQVLRDLLGDMYHVEALVLGPEHLGWWVNRPRKFCILTLKNSMVQTIIEPTKIFEVFARTRPESPACARADMFYVAPEHQVSQDCRRRLKRRLGCDVRGVEHNLGLPPLSEGAEVRRYFYQKTYIDKLFGHGSAANLLKQGHDLTRVCADLCERCGVPFVCDLEQNPVFGNLALHGVMPTLLSHGNYYSFAKQRSLLPSEFFVAQGFPLYDLGPFRVPWGTAIEGMSDCVVKDLAGNSMHLEVMWSLCLWVLSNTVRAVADPTHQLSCHAALQDRGRSEGCDKEALTSATHPGDNGEDIAEGEVKPIGGES